MLHMRVVIRISKRLLPRLLPRTCKQLHHQCIVIHARWDHDRSITTAMMAAASLLNPQQSLLHALQAPCS
ncbi:MAG: hypothetical protein CMJ19_23465 [Phycisphaeraceae bacterium]|nr:hypothetical protein [Phycisphaeraceae bacterium]